MKFPEQFRFSHPSMGGHQSHRGDTFGCFVIPAFNAPRKRRLRIIATDGDAGAEDTGWEHVSVSLDSTKAIPTWDEMCYVKNLFWDGSECVVQFHPAKSDHINIHNGCLHLWHCRKQQFPMPPKICV